MKRDDSTSSSHNYLEQLACELAEVKSQLAAEKQHRLNLLKSIEKPQNSEQSQPEDIQKALQESENKFKTIFNSRQNIIAITSIEEGRFIEVNDSFERVTGYLREETIGCTVNELGIWPHFEEQTNISAGLVNTAGQPGSVETILKTKTGEFRTGVFWSDVVMIEGEPYLLSEWLDITERKEAEKALLQLNETLEQQVAERTKLAEARAMELQSLTMEIVESEERVRKRIAMLLHEDLQQLLAGTKLQLQAACQTLPETISLDNFLQVDTLLTESIQKSRCLSHELSPPILHHSGLIPGLEWLCRHMNEQFGLHVSLKSDTSLSIDNLTVKVFLYRAVQELLFNIVKHAQVKNAVVHLFDAASVFSLTVSDEGRGFKPDIFKSTTEKIGFGLVSLRERSRSLGGELVIESAPGQGSRFTVTVPVSLARLPDTPQLNLRDKDKRLVYASQKLFVFDKIRVLFADDHHVMRKGLIEMVRGQEGIVVVGEAANGKEAITQVRKLKPEVVVMDVSMPEMNGMEATREIKAKWPDVRVIGLSMYEDPHITQAMRRAGAELLLSKTASSSELLQAIYGKTGPHRL